MSHKLCEALGTDPGLPELGWHLFPGHSSHQRQLLQCSLATCCTWQHSTWLALTLCCFAAACRHRLIACSETARQRMCERDTFSPSLPALHCAVLAREQAVVNAHAMLRQHGRPAAAAATGSTLNQPNQLGQPCKLHAVERHVAPACMCKLSAAGTACCRSRARQRTSV